MFSGGFGESFFVSMLCECTYLHIAEKRCGKKETLILLLSWKDGGFSLQVGFINKGMGMEGGTLVNDAEGFFSLLVSSWTKYKRGMTKLWCTYTQQEKRRTPHLHLTYPSHFSRKKKLWKFLH